MEDPVTIASAVVLPSQDDASPPAGPSKRRQLPDAYESTKRPRLERGNSGHGNTVGEAGITGGAAPDAPAVAADRADANAKTGEDAEESQPRSRRRLGADEEKKRGRRLFGALLGTIGKFEKDSASQRARNSAVKRKEVEAKLQAKLKQQTEELDERRKRENEDYNLRRKIEQREFEERSVGADSGGHGFVYGGELKVPQMQIRHANMAAEANMLATNASPKLFYLPWKLLPADEDTIRVQKENVEALIRREELDFERRREQDEEQLRALGGDTTNNENGSAAIEPHPNSTPPPIGEDDGKGDRDTDGTEIVPHPAPDSSELLVDTNHDNDNTTHDESISEHRRHFDLGDTADIIEEGGEDTVIY